MALMTPDGGQESFRVPTVRPTLIRAEFIDVITALVREVARTEGITQKVAFDRMPRVGQ